MILSEIEDRDDIEDIVARFYDSMLKDPIIGFIFTDVAKIHLESHLPIIVDFWHDSLFGSKLYQRNTLLKHIEIHEKMPLRAGHFTRWLHLFNKAVTERHQGKLADQMLETADRIAKTITAAIQGSKRSELRLTLNDLQTSSKDEKTE